MTSEIISKAVAAALAAAEPPTTYELDCFVTSEIGHNNLLTRCRPVQPGGAYLGVGPCQNFTYIGSLRSSCALIVDARIDNLLEHLIFKLIFERAQTPAEYLALLCSRNLAPEVPPTAASLLSAFDEASAPPELFAGNWRLLRDQLVGRWMLHDDALVRAERIYREFYRRGIDVTSVSGDLLGKLDYIPSLRTVIASTAYTGESFHYLTSIERYTHVRELQCSDRIVPVLGNLTDSRTVAIANSLLLELGAEVSAIYLSNMEEFLLHRYEIGSEGVASRPNPTGALTGEWGSAYNQLVESLRSISTTPDCLLIRFFFPGEDHVFHYGSFPWLAEHVLPLPRFLQRYKTEKPRTVFDTYW